MNCVCDELSLYKDQSISFWERLNQGQGQELKKKHCRLLCTRKRVEFHQDISLELGKGYGRFYRPIDGVDVRVVNKPHNMT